MKILFIAPRFHTNQYPTSKELINMGHEVVYLVQDVGVTEDYKFLTPIRMKPSAIIGKLIKTYVYKKYDRPTAESKMVNHFVPSYRGMKKHLEDIAPDLVILRDRNPSTIIATKACKKLGIKNVVLYNQSSLYSFKSEKQGFIKRWIFTHCPQIRYTISKINNYKDLTERKDDLYIKEHDYFVPYVAPFNPDAQGRSYFKDGKLNIIDMGKFRPYKNHYLFIDAVALLRERGKLKDINFTILGQAKFDAELKYFDEVGEYVKKRGLDDVITLRKNIPYKEMGNMYLQQDVFVLCSHNELASISILEAMCNGVVPISTSWNGPAFYIKENETGMIFETENAADLADKFEYLSEHRERIPEMGSCAYQYIQDNCMFENFFEALDALLRKEFGITLSTTDKTAK